MARKKVEAIINQRPFIMVYQDFLESDILKNCYQKVIYIYLKLFADAEGKCFPSVKRLAKLTRISINKVKSTLKELIQMGLVRKEHRIRPDGGTDSNLYTINDSSETWGAGDRPDGKRPFVKVYKDFLENDRLDSCHQRLIYIYLGKFANAKQECFPSVKKLAGLTKIGISKVKSTLNELKEKGMIDKKNRWRKDGGKNSNLYTLLYNFKKKLNKSDNKEVDGNMDDYGAVKEKGLDSEPAKEQNQALKSIHIDNYTKPNPQDCQEKYSREKIHEYFGYDSIIARSPLCKADVDSVMDILHDTLNTTKPTITVNGDSKPNRVVIGALMKLDEEAILYAIKQFEKQSAEQRIKNPKAYMLTILYNAATGGFNLDIKNQVAYDMRHWDEDLSNLGLDSDSEDG